MKRKTAASNLAAILAVSCSLFAAGCLFGSSSKTTYRGQYVAADKIGLVKPGASKSNVQDTFGEPTTKTVENGVETWRYHFSKATTKQGAVLFIFATSSETEHEGTVIVEFKADVVAKVFQQ